MTYQRPPVGYPARPPVIRPMPDYGLRAAAEETVFQSASIDPLGACRALARGLRRQTVGGKLTVMRRLAEMLDEHEPGILRQIANDLSRVAADLGELH